MMEFHDGTDRAEPSKDANDVSNEFYARLGHELRTPLNSVIGFSRYLKQNGGDITGERETEMLGAINRNGEQLLSVIEDVLEFSRLQAGKLDVVCDETDVVAVVTDVMREFEDLALRKGLSLCLHAPESSRVGANALRLAEVFRKILTNAIRFTEEGSVTVAIVNISDTDERTQNIIVTDTGAGISEDCLEGLFDPFLPRTRVIARARAGAGLGLPIARQLCQAMGCKLLVNSEVGRGSTFSIHFPEFVER
jgi:Signal transduction histidine kinase